MLLLLLLLLLVTGVIGITTFASHLIDLQDGHGRDIVLPYSVSDPRQISYRAELESSLVKVVLISIPEIPDLPDHGRSVRASPVDVLRQHVLISLDARSSSPVRPPPSTVSAPPPRPPARATSTLTSSAVRGGFVSGYRRVAGRPLRSTDAGRRTEVEPSGTLVLSFEDVRRWCVGLSRSRLELTRVYRRGGLRPDPTGSLPIEAQRM